MNKSFALVAFVSFVFGSSLVVGCAGDAADSDTPTPTIEQPAPSSSSPAPSASVPTSDAGAPDAPSDGCYPVGKDPNPDFECTPGCWYVDGQPYHGPVTSDVCYRICMVSGRLSSDTSCSASGDAGSADTDADASDSDASDVPHVPTLEMGKATDVGHIYSNAMIAGGSKGFLVAQQSDLNSLMSVTTFATDGTQLKSTAMLPHSNVGFDRIDARADGSYFMDTIEQQAGMWSWYATNIGGDGALLSQRIDYLYPQAFKSVDGVMTFAEIATLDSGAYGVNVLAEQADGSRKLVSACAFPEVDPLVDNLAVRDFAQIGTVTAFGTDHGYPLHKNIVELRLFQGSTATHTVTLVSRDLTDWEINNHGIQVSIWKVLVIRDQFGVVLMDSRSGTTDYTLHMVDRDGNEGYVYDLGKATDIIAYRDGVVLSSIDSAKGDLVVSVLDKNMLPVASIVPTTGVWWNFARLALSGDTIGLIWTPASDQHARFAPLTLK